VHPIELGSVAQLDLTSNISEKFSDAQTNDDREQYHYERKAIHNPNLSTKSDPDDPATTSAPDPNQLSLSLRPAAGKIIPRMIF
jgi:hypothetical protein